MKKWLITNGNVRQIISAIIIGVLGFFAVRFVGTVDAMQDKYARKESVAAIQQDIRELRNVVQEGLSDINHNIIELWQRE